jgi:hypothetical protein
MLAVGCGDAGGFLAAMLKSVEGEIGFACGVRMAVDGDDATFFAKLWVSAIPGLKIGNCGTRSGSGQRTGDQRKSKCRSFDSFAIATSLRMTVRGGDTKGRGEIGDAFNSLEEQSAHAVTSLWRFASRAEAQRD